MRYAPRPLHLGHLVACLAISTLTSCHLTPAVHGSGQILEVQRQVSGFHGVEVSGSGQVIVTHGDYEALRIECDDNLLPHIESTVTDGILHIGFEDGNWRPSERVIYRVTGPEFSAFRIRGSADLVCPSMQGEGVDLTLSGSGTARIGTVAAKTVDVVTSGSGRAWIEELTAEDAYIRISGSGKVSVADGEVHRIEAKNSGSGDLEMPDVRTTNATVRISGSGTADLWAEEALSARISGSGVVGIRGDPQIDLRVSGSGSVHKLGSAQY